MKNRSEVETQECVSIAADPGKYVQIITTKVISQERSLVEIVIRQASDCLAGDTQRRAGEALYRHHNRQAAALRAGSVGKSVDSSTA